MAAGIPERVYVRGGGTVESGTFGVSVATDKSLDEAVAALDAALRERRFAVLWDLDVRAKLAEKGVAGGPEFRILEVCSAPRAKEALDRDLAVGYFLPCKMVVYREGDRTRMGLLRPSALMTFLDDAYLQAFARDVEAVLVEALEAASRA
jgi:uncharacterized protein (DUF302 family)